MSRVQDQDFGAGSRYQEQDFYRGSRDQGQDFTLKVSRALETNGLERSRGQWKIAMTNHNYKQCIEIHPQHRALDKQH